MGKVCRGGDSNTGKSFRTLYLDGYSTGCSNKCAGGFGGVTFGGGLRDRMVVSDFCFDTIYQVYGCAGCNVVINLFETAFL